jgi:hypothetical protein
MSSDGPPSRAAPSSGVKDALSALGCDATTLAESQQIIFSNDQK